MGDIDDPDVVGAKAVDGNYEHLMDPERARERQRMAEEKRNGSFGGSISADDCAAARDRLLQPREVDHNPNRACLRGDPGEKGGVITKEEYATMAATRRERDQKVEDAERMKDPDYRRQLAAEKAEEDRAAFAKDAEEREKRIGEKRQKLLAGEEPAGAKKSGKRAKLSFDDEEEEPDF